MGNFIDFNIGGIIMKIETKYDVRDRVWFMPMFGDTPVCVLWRL